MRRLELPAARRARGRRAGRGGWRARPPASPSCTRSRARPRATRSSSRRSCVTSVTPRARWSEEMTLEEAGVPDGVREVTAGACGAPEESTRAVLLVASVIGREFDYDVDGRRVAGGRRAGGGGARGGRRGARAGEAGHVGRYAFTHALVRATLYDSISQLRRARLHGRVGRRWCACVAVTSIRTWRMLAHHFAQAAPVERPDWRSTSPSPPPARRPEPPGRRPPSTTARRCGRASWPAPSTTRSAPSCCWRWGLRGPGRVGGGGARHVPGRDPARCAARRRRVAHARGVGRRGTVVGPEPLRPGRVGLLDEALQALPEDDSPLRARLLARMSLESTTPASPSCACR